MNVLVALRLVPDVSGEIEIAEDEKDIDREWLDLRLNEFDDYALEEAILLKERGDAKVTAIAIAGDGVERMLQSALARGADEAVKIAWEGDAPPSSRTAARLFAAGARDLSADLVLTGVLSSEETYGQLAPFVAAALDWPCVSSVNEVRVRAGVCEVVQELSGGATATIRMATPAVAGMQTASRPVRYVSGSKLREAAGRNIPTLQLSVEAADERAERLRVSLPDSSQRANLLPSDVNAAAAALRQILTEHGLWKA